MRGVNGLHHITAIAGPAQENLDFYAGVLGMRLVKRSVNQDDPGTYHLFYADAEGSPGSDLTFFPWSHAAPPRAGHGMAMEVGLEVPQGSLGFWAERLQTIRKNDRIGDAVRPARACAHRSARFEPRPRRSGRPPALHTVGEGAPSPPNGRFEDCTAHRCGNGTRRLRRQFLTSALGFRAGLATENGWTRYGCDARARASSTCARRPKRDAARGVSARFTISPGASMTTSINWRRACARRQRWRSSDPGDRSVLVQVGLFQRTRRRPFRAGH